MSIDVACACGKRMKAKPEHAGKRVKCPGCKAVLTVPKVESEILAFEQAPAAPVRKTPAPESLSTILDRERAQKKKKSPKGMSYGSTKFLVQLGIVAAIALAILGIGVGSYFYFFAFTGKELVGTWEIEEPKQAAGALMEISRMRFMELRIPGGQHFSSRWRVVNRTGDTLNLEILEQGKQIPVTMVLSGNDRLRMSFMNITLQMKRRF